MAAFDWYQGTVRAGPDDVLEACLSLADGARIRHTKGMYGYSHQTWVEDEGGTLAQVWHGGIQAHPHVVFTSDAAPAGADMIRARFPGHTVTRVDVKEDFGGHGTFDRFLSAVLEAARKHRVKVDTRGDHLLRQEARTVYLGSSSSVVRFRQYDKAAELRSKFARDPVRLAEVPEHLTRLEVQVRPKDQTVRQGLATVEPAEVFGASQWVSDIWQAATGSGVEPIRVTRAWRQGDDQRAYSAMLQQYGRMLSRMLVDHGSWAAVGCQLGSDLAERAKAERTRGGAS